MGRLKLRSLMYALVCVLALHGFTESATAAEWTSCGNEDTAVCTLPNNKPVIVSFGAGGNTFFNFYSNTTTAPCTFENLGDPAYGSIKSCSYTHDISFDKEVVCPEQCLKCPPGNPACMKSCQRVCPAGDGPIWATAIFTNNSTQVANTVHAVQDSDYGCSYGVFRYDDKSYPLPTPTFGDWWGNENGFGNTDAYTLSCPTATAGSQLNPGPAVFDTEPTWSFCAEEGGNCMPPANQQVLLRFGADGAYTYQIAILNSSIICGGEPFGADPTALVKQCWYTPLRNGIFSAPLAKGRWSVAGSCGGAGASCSYQKSYGTSLTNTSTVTKHWSETVTASISAGFEVDGAKLQPSISVSETYGQSKTVSSALEKTTVTTETTQCKQDGSSGPITVYQFSIEATAPCLASGTCSGTTYPGNTWCARNPPDGYNGPQCVPGYCKDGDPFCQTCTYKKK